jgi:spermidine/putrescine transport system substrate-binding protein
MLWDEHNRGRIALLDSAADAWCAAALAAGLRADTDQAGEQAKLLEFMARLADNAASVTSSAAALQRDLVSGKVVAAMAWADVAREAAKGGLPVHFARPREGSLIWVCGLVLARDAPHLDMAYDLIDGMLAPDIGALCIRSFRYGHSNLASFASLSDAALAAAALPRDPSPILETGLIRVEPPPAMRADVARLWSRLQATMGDADQDGPCACGGPKAVRGRALRAARIPGVPPPI